MEPIVHICAPQVESWMIRRWKCPTCGKRRMLVEMFEWYPATVSCLNCGDVWHEGERAPRPFYRNWRAEAVEELKRHLKHLSQHAKERASQNADTQRVVKSYCL
jgi:ribosomal protein S27E